MKLSILKNTLADSSALNIQLPNGQEIPTHFHITEVGLSTKQFVDCGGTMRKEAYANFQIWVASDVEHRLSPSKLLKIIESTEHILDGEDLEVEIEYQTDTVGRYGLAFNGSTFQLTNKQTDCLAKDTCAPSVKKETSLKIVEKASGCCTPGGGCC